MDALAESSSSNDGSGSHYYSSRHRSHSIKSEENEDHNFNTMELVKQFKQCRLRHGSLAHSHHKRSPSRRRRNDSYESRHRSSSTPLIMSYCKDGRYYLTTARREKSRLISMSKMIDGYQSVLKHFCVTDDTMEVLRLASGKSRRVATELLVQFEGLCHSNINYAPNEKYPITVNAIEGVWEIVRKKIIEVEHLFHLVESMKANSWARPDDWVDAKVFRMRKSRRTGPKKRIEHVFVHDEYMLQQREASRAKLRALRRLGRIQVLQMAAKDADFVKIFVKTPNENN